MSPGTPQLERSGFDLAGACAALDAWLHAHEDEALNLETAQVSLRAVREDMLANWMDQHDRTRHDAELMFGVALLSLAESAAWAQMSNGAERPADYVAATVQRARALLRIVGEA